MPGYNDWNVSYSTISFVERSLQSHSKVAQFVRSQEEMDPGNWTVR